MKKTIAVATFFAATTSIAKIENGAQALEQLTGPKQAESGEAYEICLSVNPYFFSSPPQPGKPSDSHFHALVINGSGAWTADETGSCSTPDQETKKCEVGFVKVTSTAPIACNVPVGL